MNLKLGSSYPVTDLGTDPAPLRDFAQGIESIGYDDIYISEHILGAKLDNRSDWKPYSPVSGKFEKPIYDETEKFFEGLVAVAFLAGITSRLTLNTSVMVLGMRQTALVAKQAAVADVLSGGRVRLGVGAGWNDVEYTALGIDFKTRGARMDEQIAVLRALWTQDAVTFKGRFHDIPAAGINPLPIQRPIPLLIAGYSDAAMNRAAKIGDGWYPGLHLTDEGKEQIARFWKLVDDSGRKRSDVALIGIIRQGPREPEAVIEEMLQWQNLGASCVNVRTSRYPVHWAPESGTPTKATVDDHLESLRRVREGWLAAQPAR